LFKNRFEKIAQRYEKGRKGQSNLGQTELVGGKAERRKGGKAERRKAGRRKAEGGKKTKGRRD